MIGLLATGSVAAAGYLNQDFVVDQVAPTIFPAPGPEKYDVSQSLYLGNLSEIRQPEFAPKAGIVSPEVTSNILNKPSKLPLVDRLNAIDQNTVTLMFAMPDKRTSLGTGLIIDQGGIILTAAHLFLERPDRSAQHGIMYDFAKRKSFQITQAIFDHWRDLAICIAPTNTAFGNPLFEIDTQPIQTGEELIQNGILRNHQHLFRSRMQGVAIDPLPRSIKGVDKSRELRLVWGMIPFGGSSGGPIFDVQGRIRAVESGFFTDSSEYTNERDAYKGSTVAPLSHLPRILKEGRIIRFS